MMEERIAMKDRIEELISKWKGLSDVEKYNIVSYVGLPLGIITIPLSPITAAYILGATVGIDIALLADVKGKVERGIEKLKEVI